MATEFDISWHETSYYKPPASHDLPARKSRRDQFVRSGSNKGHRSERHLPWALALATRCHSGFGWCTFPQGFTVSGRIRMPSPQLWSISNLSRVTHPSTTQGVIQSPTDPTGPCWESPGWMPWAHTTCPQRPWRAGSSCPDAASSPRLAPCGATGTSPRWWRNPAAQTARSNPHWWPGNDARCGRDSIIPGKMLGVWTRTPKISNKNIIQYQCLGTIGYPPKATMPFLCHSLQRLGQWMFSPRVQKQSGHTRHHDQVTYSPLSNQSRTMTRCARRSEMYTHKKRETMNSAKISPS